MSVQEGWLSQRFFSHHSLREGTYAFAIPYSKLFKSGVFSKVKEFVSQGGNSSHLRVYPFWQGRQHIFDTAASHDSVPPGSVLLKAIKVILISVILYMYIAYVCFRNMKHLLVQNNFSLPLKACEPCYLRVARNLNERYVVIHVPGLRHNVLFCILGI